MSELDCSLYAMLASSMEPGLCECSSLSVARPTCFPRNQQVSGTSFSSHLAGPLSSQGGGCADALFETCLNLRAVIPARGIHGPLYRLSVVSLHGTRCRLQTASTAASRSRGSWKGAARQLRPRTLRPSCGRPRPGRPAKAAGALTRTPTGGRKPSTSLCSATQARSARLDYPSPT